jgi:Coenzyme PQQ synthesis protein D (PqqD)
MFRLPRQSGRAETVDGGIPLDVHHRQMFCLNVVGSKTLETMQRCYDESHIDEISQDYGVNRDVVRKDAIEFIDTLHKRHILQPVAPAAT